MLEQLAFWKVNQPLFLEAHRRQPQLVDLTEQVKSLAKKHNTQADALNLLRRERGFYKSALLTPEQSKIDRFDKEETILVETASQQKRSLNEMNIQLDLEREPFDAITAHIDCKLPTFVAGAALVKKGMDVSVAFRYPQHPWLIVGKKRTKGPPLEMFVDYFPDAGRFQSSPHVFRIEDDIKFSDIVDLRSGSIHKSLIRAQDPWPMPFDTHTLELFDAWSTK